MLLKFVLKVILYFCDIFMLKFISNIMVITGLKSTQGLIKGAKKIVFSMAI